MSIRCESCESEIADEGISYRMKIQLYADPSPPVFTEEDLLRDAGKEIQQLLAQMGEADVEEMQDQVYEAYEFVLCSACRRKIHTDLKARKPPLV